MAAITAVNAYVEAFNAGGPEAQSKKSPAIDALHASANQVAMLLGPLSSPRLRDATASLCRCRKARGSGYPGRFWG